MPLPVCRLNDIAIGSCPCHLGIPVVVTIIMASPTCLSNGLGVAKMNDIGMSSCGHVATIMMGNPTVLTNGLPTARVTDMMLGPAGCPTATLVIGSPNVIA